jgi:hypothetical protein
MDFAQFKSGCPAQAMFRRMGLIKYLEAANSWRALQDIIIRHNNKADGGAFVAAAKHYAGQCSSGEQVVLHALLYALDFASLADELDGGWTWRRMNKVSGAHRQAVVACIRLED